MGQFSHMGSKLGGELCLFSIDSVKQMCTHLSVQIIWVPALEIKTKSKECRELVLNFLALKCKHWGTICQKKGPVPSSISAFFLKGFVDLHATGKLTQTSLTRTMLTTYLGYGGFYKSYYLCLAISMKDRFTSIITHWGFVRINLHLSDALQSSNKSHKKQHCTSISSF